MNINLQRYVGIFKPYDSAATYHWWHSSTSFPSRIKSHEYLFQLMNREVILHSQGLWGIHLDGVQQRSRWVIWLHSSATELGYISSSEIQKALPVYCWSKHLAVLSLWTLKGFMWSVRDVNSRFKILPSS